MMNLVLGIVLLLGAGVAVAFYVAFRAPVGYEDETGFHYGPENTESANGFHGAVPAPAR